MNMDRESILRRKNNQIEMMKTIRVSNAESGIETPEALIVSSARIVQNCDILLGQMRS